ncbi:MAG: hypothetical protein Q8N83_06425 [Ignavibacteria bacterium]|nr:hypothetical protein [Ignavibacteria bacterium]
MGEIIFWTLVRIMIIIPTIYILRNYLDYSVWWSASFLLIYGVVLHPAIQQFRYFLEKNKEVLESTLCSSCEHFDKSAVLCMKHDEHPTENYLPCDGIDWSPKSKGNEVENISE